MSSDRWEVLQFTICDGWVNNWHEDDQPQTFASRQEAEDDLDEYLCEMYQALSRGDVEDVPSRNEFVIRRVGDSRDDLNGYVPIEITL